LQSWLFWCYSFSIQICLCVSLRQAWRPLVVGGWWVGSHGPMGGGPSLRWISRPLERGPGLPEGHRSGGVEIVSVCGLPAWQALGAQSGRVRVGLRGESLR
jgi:hypothetical protein